MSEQLLDCPDVIAIFQQMCCQGFPFELFYFDRLLKTQYNFIKQSNNIKSNVGLPTKVCDKAKKKYDSD